MDKQNMTYTGNGMLLALQKGKILTHCMAWINLEDILLNKVTRRKILCDSIYTVPTVVRFKKTESRMVVSKD